MLDFPAGVVPTGTISLDDDKFLADETFWPTGCDLTSALSLTLFSLWSEC